MTDSSDNIADDMSEYLQAYLDETDEELETLVQALLTLEDDPRAESALNEAFRMMHSLKGSSGMMGFEGIADLAHHLENRFDQVRSGNTELNRSTMDVMLECVDFFRAFAENLRAGEPTNEDTADLVRRLNQNDSPDGPDTPTQPETPTAAPATDFTLGGGLRVRVTFQRGLQLADLKARLIMARLSNVGEIVGSDPPIDDVQSFDDLPQFVVMLTTDRPAEEILKIASVDGVESVDLDGQPATPVAPSSDIAEEFATDKAPATSSSPSTVELSTEDLERLRQQTRAESVDEFETTDREFSTSEPVDETVDAALSDSDSPVEESADGTIEEILTPEQPSEGVPVEAKEASKPRVAETVRVEIDRLDRLMNLTGELVVTNARFNQISEQISPALKNARGANRMSGIADRLRRGLLQLRRIGDERDGLNGWHHVLDELDEDLDSLAEDSTMWDEGRRHFTQIAEAIDQLTRVSKNLQQGVLDTRMMPVGPLFGRFKRVIRDIANERGKSVELIIRGEKTELDKRMIDELGDPLLHLIRNSVDHGLEAAHVRRNNGKRATGRITLEASHSGNNVFVTITDDGAGINVEKVRSRIIERVLTSAQLAASMTDEQVIDYIFHPGFSTADQVTDISGRGVGMDIVKSRISELNGSIEVASEAGKGTTFTLRLPLTLAIIRSLMIRFRDGVYTIPIDDVREIVSVPAEKIYSVHGHETIDVRGEFIPLTSMDRVFDWSHLPKASGDNTAAANVVILQSRGKTLGLCVDELLGGADIVIKSLANNFVSIHGLSGASIMGDGSVCLMLDTDVVIGLV